jgi:RimJ/RimL family protein N-acetyltransferase
MTREVSPMPEVRYAVADDLDLWRTVRLRSLADSPDSFGSTLEREQAFTEDEWVARMSPPAVLVLDDQGGPIGLGGGFEVRPGVLLVVAMWVEPAWRGRGLSRRVLDLVVDWAREHDLEVELDVTRDNPSARAAYERYGFVYTGGQEPLREGSPIIMDRMALPRRAPAPS